MIRFLALTVAACAVCLAPAIGRANLIADGSFETPIESGTPEADFFGGSLLGPWSVLGNDVLIIQTEATESGITFNAEDGSQAVDLTGSGNSGLADGISQTISTTLGVTYSISFFRRHRAC